MPWCNECGEHYLKGFGHTHAPSWEVRIAITNDVEDLDHDNMYEEFRVQARNEERAAEMAASTYEVSSGDWMISGDGEMAMVAVRRHGSDGLWKRFVVSGEMTPVYNAQEV